MDNSWWDQIRFFKPSDFACPCCGQVKIDWGLVRCLDSICEWIKEPIRITSGYRCPKHNEEVGGVPDSAHTKGLAVDIHIPDNKFRYEVIDYATLFGIPRIGIGKNFIHLDIDETKPHPRLWVY